MGCNCEPKKYSISMGCCQPVLAPIENYYTKYQVDKLIESATTSGTCCITPEEVDEKIASAKTDIENEIPSLSGYATEQWVEDKHYITGVDLSDYATEQWVLDKHYISGVDLSDYALKSEIPTVPTSNTAFTNDAGYLTEHQSLTAYSTTNEVNTAIEEATSGNVDTSVYTAYTAATDVILSGKDDTTAVTQSINEATSGKTNNSDFTAHTADTSIHLTSGDVQTQIDNSISGKADTTAIYNYVSGDRINVKTAPGVRTKSINLNLPIYSGNGSSSVSVNITSSVSGNGDNHIVGSGSFGAGYMIETKHIHEAAFGVYNVSNGQTQVQEQFVHSSGNTLFSVGNGKPQNTGGSLRRHNAFEIRQNGDIYIADTNDTTIDEPQRKPMIKLQDKLDSLDATIGDINTILESI